MTPRFCLFAFLFWFSGFLVCHSATGEAEEVELQIYLWPNRMAQQMGQRAERAALASEAAGQPRGTHAGGEAALLSYDATGMGDWQTVPLQVGEKTATFRYRGPREIVFYQGNGTGEQPRRALGQVRLPDHVRKLILIFTPQSGGVFEILPVANGEDVIPVGQALIYNLTDETLGISLGTDVFELAAGSSVLSPLAKGSRYYQQVLVASQDKDGIWIRRLARKMTVQDSNSLIIFIYKDPERSSQQLSLVRLLSRT